MFYYLHQQNVTLTHSDHHGETMISRLRRRIPRSPRCPAPFWPRSGRARPRSPGSPEIAASAPKVPNWRLIEEMYDLYRLNIWYDTLYIHRLIYIYNWYIPNDWLYIYIYINKLYIIVGHELKWRRSSVIIKFGSVTYYCILVPGPAVIFPVQPRRCRRISVRHAHLVEFSSWKLIWIWWNASMWLQSMRLWNISIQISVKPRMPGRAS